ncbi:hypothetical protein D3C86_1214000 [compost metagenome]
MAFIRILSPKSAPPVLRFDGSTEIRPIVFSGKSIRNLRTNSSTKEDFPAPPVPVIPNTGILLVSFCLWIVSKVSFAISGKFSAAEITRAIAVGFLSSRWLASPFSLSPIGKSDFCTKSLIMP